MSVVSNSRLTSSVFPATDNIFSLIEEKGITFLPNFLFCQNTRGKYPPFPEPEARVGFFLTSGTRKSDSIWVR